MTDPRDVRIAQLEGVLRDLVLVNSDCTCAAFWADYGKTDPNCAYHEMQPEVDAARAALTPKPDAPPAPYGQGSGPLPGKNVTVVQTGDKTLFITAPDAPPVVKDCPTAPPLTDGRLREVAERLRIEIQHHWQEWQDSNAYPDPMEAFLIEALSDARDRSQSDDSDRIETLEGALRRANDRLAALVHQYPHGNSQIFKRMIATTPTLIEEGEKALREEESEECPNCANPPHDGPCRRKSQEAR